MNKFPEVYSSNDYVYFKYVPTEFSSYKTLISDNQEDLHFKIYGNI